MSHEVEQLVIPAALDDTAAARDFVDTVEARNAAEAAWRKDLM